MLGSDPNQEVNERPYLERGMPAPRWILGRGQSQSPLTRQKNLAFPQIKFQNENNS